MPGKAEIGPDGPIGDQSGSYVASVETLRIDTKVFTVDTGHLVA